MTDDRNALVELIEQGADRDLLRSRFKCSALIKRRCIQRHQPSLELSDHNPCLLQAL